MTPYIILLIIPVIFSLSRSHSKRNNAILAYFIVLLLILSLRSINVGTDLVSYSPTFRSLVNAEWIQVPEIVREVGYGYLNKIIGYLTTDFQVFLSIVAVIIIIPLYFLYRESNNWNYLKVVIFMNMATFSMMFSGLRQAIAISLGVCAYYALIGKKLWLYFLIIAAAYFIHHSAVILIVLFPLSLFNFKRKHLLLLIPLFILLLAFRTQIAAFVLAALSSSDELSIYSERYNEFSDTGAYGTLALFAIFTAISYIFTDEKKMPPRVIFLRNILVAATFFQIVALLNPVTMRINYYFIAFVPIAFPMCLEYCKDKEKRFVKTLGVCLALVLTGYYINRAFYGQDTLSIYPYEAFWEIPVNIY